MGNRSMHSLGRTFQFAGLTILPMAILLELQGVVSLGKSLTIAFFGVILFCLGHVVQGYAKK